MGIDAAAMKTIEKVLGVSWQTDETTAWNGITIDDSCGQLNLLLNSASGDVCFYYTTNSSLTFSMGLSFSEFDLKYLDALPSYPVLSFYKAREDGLRDQIQIVVMEGTKITKVRFLSGVDSSVPYQI